MCGLTQKAMADKIGLSLVAYCQKENALREFTHSEMKAILNIIREHVPGLTLDDIFLA